MIGFQLRKFMNPKRISFEISSAFQEIMGLQTLFFLLTPIIIFNLCEANVKFHKGLSTFSCFVRACFFVGNNLMDRINLANYFN